MIRPQRFCRSALMVALLSVPGCGTLAWPAPDPAYRESDHHARNDSLLPGMLASVEGELVDGWTGPGGRPFAVARRTEATETGPARRFGSITRSIALRDRAAALSQYPCEACHQGRRLIVTGGRRPDAHQNIEPRHPEATGASCSTCHLPDDVARLAVAGRGPATLNHSYRLCGQCHFAQADAWAGGAHGKRLDGWQGRRVVLACTDCHDPHAPGVAKRLPFRAPELERPRTAGPRP